MKRSAVARRSLNKPAANKRLRFRTAWMGVNPRQPGPTQSIQRRRCIFARLKLKISVKAGAVSSDRRQWPPGLHSMKKAGVQRPRLLRTDPNSHQNPRRKERSDPACAMRMRILDRRDHPAGPGRDQQRSARNPAARAAPAGLERDINLRPGGGAHLKQSQRGFFRVRSPARACRRFGDHAPLAHDHAPNAWIGGRAPQLRPRQLKRALHEPVVVCARHGSGGSFCARSAFR